MKKDIEMNRPSPLIKQHKNRIVELIVPFLERVLPQFLTNSIHAKQSLDEDSFSEVLYHYLVQNGSTNFYFTQQPLQDGRRKVDIGVSLYWQSPEKTEVAYVFCLEAKFLPCHDYVMGEYAAIKRFKLNQHGIKSRYDKTPLPENGIVAYVRDQDFEKHFENINNEIILLSLKNEPNEFNLVWSESEKLDLKGSIGNYISIHIRIDNSYVTLHHFWVHV
ncbi:MAG: hypothetical protein WAT22_08810 [Saprospiraceae bacterium]|nr:hypothetical protein [Saprospiraceae bacterium]